MNCLHLKQKTIKMWKNICMQKLLVKLRDLAGGSKLMLTWRDPFPFELLWLILMYRDDFAMLYSVYIYQVHYQRIPHDQFEWSI